MSIIWELVRMQILRLSGPPESIQGPDIQVIPHTLQFKNHWGRVYLSEDRSDSKLPKYILAAELVVWHESLMPASDVSKNYADVWGWGQSTQSWINDSDKQSFPRVWAHVPQRAAGKRPAASSKGICGQRVRKGLEEKSDRERELQGGERVDLVRNEQSPSKE